MSRVWGFSLSWFCSAGGAGNGVWPLQQVETSSSVRCGVYGIAVFLCKCLCAHSEPPPNGSWLISLALSTNVVCIGSLVKECVWESPGSRNGLYVNLCCSSAQGKSLRKLCSEPVSQSHCQNLRGKRGGQLPKQRCLLAA